MEGLNGVLGAVVSWVQSQPGIALLCLMTVTALTLAVALGSLLRIQKLEKRQAMILRGVDGASLESLLLDYSKKTTAFQSDLQRALETSDANTSGLRRALRRIGLHRYDAFANVGGQQSFSLALLDEEANGVVISGLYSRQEMRIYAKPVAKGRSDIALTPEEQRALSSARLPGETS